MGLGRIGASVARIGHAFEMRVIAWSQNMTQETANASGATLVTKSELFRQADVLTIHLVLSKRTSGLVGANELALMKPTALLINTSRGPIVDEAALIDALESDRKSTRLNSSHRTISYAVFCLKKKTSSWFLYVLSYPWTIGNYVHS